jgi:hypothetical protein
VQVEQKPIQLRGRTVERGQKGFEFVTGLGKRPVEPRTIGLPGKVERMVALGDSDEFGDGRTPEIVEGGNHPACPAADDTPGSQGGRDFLEQPPPPIGRAFLHPRCEPGGGGIEFFPRAPFRVRLHGRLRQAGERLPDGSGRLEENVEGGDQCLPIGRPGGPSRNELAGHCVGQLIKRCKGFLKAPERLVAHGSCYGAQIVLWPGDANIAKRIITTHTR